MLDHCTVHPFICSLTEQTLGAFGRMVAGVRKRHGYWGRDTKTKGGGSSACPQEAGLREESAPGEGLTPGSPGPLPCLYLFLSRCALPAQFPFRAETRRAEPPFTGASQNQDAVETVLITVVCVVAVWECGYLIGRKCCWWLVRSGATPDVGCGSCRYRFIPPLFPFSK